MDREQFEQLVSQWLDQRECDDLRRRVAAAVARDSRLKSLRDEWLKFDGALRDACATPMDNVAWDKLRARVVESIAAEQPGGAGNQTLREATSVEGRVDWAALRGRVMRSVSGVERKKAARPAAVRRRSLALVSLGAAAALLLAVYLAPREPAPPEVGLALVRVDGADQSLGGGFASVRVSAPPDAAPPETPRKYEANAPQVVEVFLMVTPAPAIDSAIGRASPFGFN